VLDLLRAAAANGNLTVWSPDQSLPQANTMVWGATTRTSTMAFTAFDEASRFNIRASVATDVVIDVVGVYR